MSDVELSVVVPVYNEAAALLELAARCATAARATGLPFEVILVDDASTDATDAIVASAALGDGVRCVRMRANRGQFRATQEGLRQAEGRWVVVLDGDLQDPPEVIGPLVDTMTRSPTELDVVFALKSQREDPGWFLVGRAVFALLQRGFSGRPPPDGAGSYCVMARPLAHRVASLEVDHVNLATVLAALSDRHASVSYAKAARYDETSRVGPMGLAREAFGSLLLTGALPRILGGGAAVLAGAALLSSRPLLTALCGVGSATLTATSVASALRRRAVLTPLRSWSLARLAQPDEEHL